MHIFKTCHIFWQQFHSFLHLILFIYLFIHSHEFVHFFIYLYSLHFHYFFYNKIYVIDSADRRRMEETGVELQQLLDEVRTYLLLVLIVNVTTRHVNSISSFVSL